MTGKTNKFYFAFLSLLGVGKIRYSPGTIASLVSLPLLYPFYHNHLLFAIVPLSIVIYFLSVGIISKHLDQPYDKHWIVIDEFLGMVITTLPFYLGVEPNITHTLLAFSIFRFFDILKPLNIRSIDNQNTPSSVINDDLVAGLYSAIALTLISSLV